MRQRELKGINLGVLIWRSDCIPEFSNLDGSGWEFCRVEEGFFCYNLLRDAISILIHLGFRYI